MMDQNDGMVQFQSSLMPEPMTCTFTNINDNLVADYIPSEHF